MTGYVKNTISIEGFKEYWDNFDDDQIDEALSNFLSIYLKSCKCSSKAMTTFLEEFADKIEKDIQALEVQIQSQNLKCQI